MILLLACTAADPDPTPAGKDSAAGNDSAEPDRDDDERPVGDPALLCQAEMSCGSPILDEPKVPCTLTLTDGAGELMHDGMAMVEKRGRSSLEFPKPQYSVELHENV